MSRHAKRNKGTSVSTHSITHVFWDNTSPYQITSSSINSITKNELDLPENAPDSTIFQKLSSIMSAGDSAMVITADGGTDMKEMEIKYRNRILVITIKIKGYKNQRLALRTLFKTGGFKIAKEVVARYSHIKLTKSEKHLNIDYADTKGKKPGRKNKVVKNVFRG